MVLLWGGVGFSPTGLVHLAEAPQLRRTGSTYLTSSPAKSNTFVMVTLAGSAALASFPSGDGGVS